MKNFICLFILLSIAFISGCDDFLENESRSKFTPTTIEDHLLTLNGFRAERFASHYSRVGFLSDDFEPQEEEYSYSEFQAYYFLAMLWEDPLIRSGSIDIVWGGRYSSIWICNNVLTELENISPADGAEQQLYNRTRGEALAHRARLYLILVNEYAKHYAAASASGDPGVPLNLGVDLEIQLSRSTVAEVYDQIINDLNEAAGLLPPMTPNFPSSAFRPGAASVYALLARVHLYRQEWEEAANAANNCLSIYDFVYDYNDSTYVPTANPTFSATDFFQDNEAIWLQTSGGQGFFSFRGMHLMSNDLIAQFDTTGSDLRWNLFTRKVDDEVHYIRAGASWASEGLDYYSNWGSSIPEVILTLAEAQARLGNIGEAMITLDRLTQYRYDQDSYIMPSAGDMTAALDIILAERRKELPFTGIRWVDQKRLIILGEYDKTLIRFNNGQTYTLAPNSPGYVQLIPQDVIDLNPSVEQNPR